MNPSKRKLYDYIFCVLVGALFLYSVNGAVLTTTIIEYTPPRLFLTGLFMLLGFMAVFYNMKTLLATTAFVTFAALFFWMTLETREEEIEFLSELILASRGLLMLGEEHHAAAVMILCGATSFFTALFLYVKFNFYIMSLTGGAVFAVGWIMNYRRDDFMFIVFMFCFFLMLIKYMSAQRGKENFGSLNALLALPLCAAALLLGSVAPGQSDGSTDNPLRVLMDKPLSALNDTFYTVFNPKYFSFQSTGFSNSAGRLGGSVTLNDRKIMYVNSPGRAYLSGAVKNVYTGDNWLNTVERDLPVSVYSPGRFEFLETASALVRETTRYDTGDGYLDTVNDRLLALQRSFPEEDRIYIQNHNMPRVFSKDIYSLIGFAHNEDYGYGITGYFGSVGGGDEQVEGALNEIKDALEGYYFVDGRQIRISYEIIPFRENGFLRSYLPLDEVTVSVINRTGSMFRPSKAWEPSILPESADSNAEFSSTPSGDWHADDLLEEGAAYSFKYLAPNTELTTVKNILKSSRRGFYSDNQTEDLLIHEYFNKLVPAGTASVYSNKSINDKASVLFNALYQTYLYTANDAGQTAGEGMTAGHYGKKSEPIGEDDFKYASSAIYNPLAYYADAVYENYTALPESLPRRVYDLAEDLTEKLETDYEKVKAIEEYLLTFPYTLEPAPLPSNADFVDYFLFEGKEGYCTYYASAMAVLARCVGLPSRYVEGFLLPASPSSDGVYVVTNEQAHTWTEVYLEGYGWLQLEPTAPFHSAVTNGNTSSVSSGLFTDDYVSSPDYQEHLSDMGFTDSAIDGTLPEVTSPPSAAVNKPFKLELSFRSAVFALLILLAAFALILIFIGLQTLREKLRRRRINKMPVNQQARVYFKGLLKITTYYHYPLRNGETVQMYGARLGKRFAFKSDTVFLRDLIAVYYKACYGNRPISDKELDLLRDCYYDMVFFLGIVRNLPRYMFLRYVRGVTSL